MKRKYKWIFTAIAIVVFISLSEVIPSLPLTARAIVIGFAVDLAEDRTVEVSAQILVPSESMGSSGQGNTRVVKGRASTVTGALNSISVQTGLVVALTHCYVIFIGRSIAEADYIYAILNNLLENTFLSENVYLAMTEDKASDIIEANLGFGESASHYTQLLMDEKSYYSTIARRTAQEFILEYNSLGGSNWLPIAVKEETGKQLITDGAKGGGGDDNKSYIIDYSQTAIFRKNKLIDEVDINHSAAINYVMKKPIKGSISFTGEDNVAINLFLLDSKAKKKYDLNKKSFSVEIEIKANLKDIIDYTGEDLYVDRLRITENEKKMGAQNIAETIKNFYNIMAQQDVDIFNTLEMFYSKYGKKALELKLSEISIEVSVRLVVGQ